jgi:hypothetical protein
MGKKPFFLRPKFMAWFVLVVMVFSVVAIVLTQFNTTGASYKYKEYTFYPTQNGWLLRLGGQRYDFSYLPIDLENVSGSKILPGEKIYILYNPGNNNITTGYSTQRLRYYLYNRGYRIVDGCITEEGCPKDLPIVDCSNATAQALYYTYGESPNTNTKEKCIYVEGKDNQDLYKASERLLYSMLGVME